MKAEWTILQDGLKGIPAAPSPFCGYVYAIELGDNLKIGRTQNPENRLKSIISYAQSYADVAPGVILISPPHTNHVRNENALHKHFADYRKSGELFRLSAQEFLDKLPGIEFLDETERLEAQCDNSVELLKSLTSWNEGSKPLHVIEGGKQGDPQEEGFDLLLLIVNRLAKHGERIKVLEQEVAALRKLVDEERRAECETCKWSKASNSGR